MTTLEALKAEIETAPEPVLKRTYDFLVAVRMEASPPHPSAPPAQWPDFAARLRNIYGDRVTPDSQDIMDALREDRF